MDLKRERKEKEEDRKIKQPVHIDLTNIFSVSQRKASTGRQLQFSQT